MTKTQLAVDVAKQTGYSISHVKNVLNGRRKNKGISEAAIKIQSANLIKKVQKRTPVIKATKTSGTLFNHKSENLFEACNIKMSVKEIFKGLDDARRQGKKTTELFEIMIKNISRHFTKKELITEPAITLLTSGYIFCKAEQFMTSNNDLGMLLTIIKGTK